MPSLDLKPAHTIKEIERNLDWAYHVSLEKKFRDPKSTEYDEYVYLYENQLTVAKLLANIKENIHG